MFNRDTQAKLNVIFYFLFFCLFVWFRFFLPLFWYHWEKKCKMAMKNINFQRYAAQTL